MNELGRLPAPAEPQPLLLSASFQQITWLIEHKQELLREEDLNPRQRYMIYIVECLLESANVRPAELWLDISSFEPAADEPAFWEAVRVIRRVLDHTSHTLKAS